MKFPGINLLEELERDELHELHAVFNTRTLPKNAIIYTPDEREDLTFIIKKGRVRVYLAYADKEFTLAILRPGDLYSTHAGCYVQSLSSTQLLVADVHAMKTLMDRNPVFTRTMVRVLGHILKNTFSIIGGLVFKDIYARLLDYIIDEAQQAGLPHHSGVLIDLNLTIEQLAQLVGASRQTVSTLLNDMLRAGFIIKHGRGQYIIPDLPALKRHASEQCI